MKGLLRKRFSIDLFKILAGKDCKFYAHKVIENAIPDDAQMIHIL